MSRNISLDLYRIFCTVVRSGNMTAAAREMFITQPAVSMAVRQLEEALGGALLVRTPKGVHTTTEGEQLYRLLEPSIRLLDTAQETYEQIRGLSAGELSIGASDTVISNLLLPHLETFHEDHPQISIKVTNKTTGECLRLLQEGQVELSFVNLPIGEQEGLEVIPCREIQDCLVGGQKYCHLAEKGLTLEELSRYPLLLLETLSNSRQYLDAYALSKGVTLQPIIELGSTDLLLEFARIGLGLTVCVREFTDFAGSGLVEIPLSPPIPGRSVGFVKQKGVALSAAGEAFAAYFI